jgi:hypothetical protein
MKGKDKIYLMVFSLIPTTLNEIFPNIDPQYTTKTAIAAITFTVVIFGTVIYNSFIVKHEEKAPKIVSRDAETNTDISTLANPQTEPSLLDSKTRLCNITINENISEEIYLKHAMKTKGTKIENGDKVVEWLNFKSKPYTSTPDMSLN